jgi:hypothetical protein
LPGFLSSPKTFSPRRFNLFGYANGNPIRVSDPNGMDGETKRTVAGVLWQVMPLAGLAFEHSDIDPGTLPHAANAAIEATGGMFGPVFEMGMQEAGKASVAADNGNTGGALFHGYMSYVFFGADAMSLVLGAEGAGAAEADGIAAKSGSLIDDAIAMARRTFMPCACFVAGTPVVTAYGLLPIESVSLGDRVEAGDPNCADEHFGVDDKVIHLQLVSQLAPDATFNMSVVRPLAWLDEQGFVDGVGWLTLDELDFAGWATVLAIEDAPLEAAGDGCLVLMTLEYTAERVVKLTLEGGTTLELTPRHPLYLERGGWTSAGAIPLCQRSCPPSESLGPRSLSICTRRGARSRTKNDGVH